MIVASFDVLRKAINYFLPIQPTEKVKDLLNIGNIINFKKNNYGDVINIIFN